MSTRPLVVAGLVGSVHAGFSLSWALGADTLLRTVGPWAEDLARQQPVASSVALLVVTAAKVAGVVVPLLVAQDRLPGPRRWRSGCRVVCLLGGGLVAAYGLVNAVVAWLVLAGVVVPEGGFDRPAMVGHAFLWDPMFLVWGALVVVGLRRRPSGAPAHQGV